MSHVERSLKNLLTTIERLDHAMDYFETAQNGKQRDMFNVPPPAPEKSNGQDALLARRLDSAIKRVEELLGEE